MKKLVQILLILVVSQQDLDQKLYLKKKNGRVKKIISNLKKKISKTLLSIDTRKSLSNGK